MKKMSFWVILDRGYSVCVSFCLSVAYDLANRLTFMVLLYSEASLWSMEGYNYFAGWYLPPPKKNRPWKNIHTSKNKLKPKNESECRPSLPTRTPFETRNNSLIRSCFQYLPFHCFESCIYTIVLSFFFYNFWKFWMFEICYTAAKYRVRHLKCPF